LQAIEDQSEKLLRKKPGFRIINKAHDAKAVAKLLEQLEQAILLYLVGAERCRD
jgi:hypothetical protein